MHHRLMISLSAITHIRFALRCDKEHHRGNYSTTRDSDGQKKQAIGTGYDCPRAFGPLSQVHMREESIQSTVYAREP